MRGFLLWIVLYSLPLHAVEPVKERVQASFWGLAYGDALGLNTESWSQENIRAAFGVHQNLTDPLPLDKIFQIAGEKTLFRSRLPGYVSDDTQQAMALLLIFLQHPNWGPTALKEWSQLLVTGLSSKAWRGTGPRFRSAVRALATGQSYTRSGAESAGLGAAMRVAPLGAMAALAHKFERTRIHNAIQTSSLVTHSDLRALAFSAAVGWTAEKLALGWSVAEIRRDLPSHVALIERQWSARTDWTVTGLASPGFSSALRKLFGAKLSTAEEVSKSVTLIGKHDLSDKKGRGNPHPNDGFVMLGGLHALGLALLDNVDPLAVLRYVVNLGDDTDTVGAIVGGLLGARFGSSWIPAMELIDYARYEAYTRSMIDGGLPESVSQFLAAEQTLTHREKQFQKRLQNDACQGAFR